MKKKVISLVMAGMMTFSLAACGQGAADKTAQSSKAAESQKTTAKTEAEMKKEEAAQADTTAAKADKDITIGSIIMNTSGEWFAEVMKGMTQAGQDLGVKVNIVSSDNEVSKESDNVSTFIAQGVDAICISPLSADGSIAAVESAAAANIPVVAWNGTVNTDKIQGFVGVDASALGGQTGDYAADYIKKNFPKGCKLALLTNENYEVAIARCKGFKDKIQPLVDQGLVEIVNEQPAELQDEGLDITEQMLTANPDIQMIWAWNQTSLLGCVAALENQNRNDIVVMGTDMSVDLAKDMLDNDKNLQAITTQMPFDIGYKSVENVVKLVKGEAIEEELIIPVKIYTKDKPDEISQYIEEHKDLVQ